MGLHGEEIHAEAQRRKERGEEICRKSLTQRRRDAEGAERRVGGSGSRGGAEAQRAQRED